MTGVPEPITRERYRELIAGFGLDPAETCHVQCLPACIIAEVYTLKDGRRFLGPDDQPATHQVTIAVVP